MANHFHGDSRGASYGFSVSKPCGTSRSKAVIGSNISARLPQESECRIERDIQSLIDRLSRFVSNPTIRAMLREWEGSPDPNRIREEGQTTVESETWTTGWSETWSIDWTHTEGTSDTGSLPPQSDRPDDEAVRP